MEASELKMYGKQIIHLGEAMAFGLSIEELYNVYTNVNLFNGRNLTMSAQIYTTKQLTNLSPNKLNNISSVPVWVSLCI